MQNAGKWLAAILEPSHGRARRRNATVDAIVVLALGTGWALALSYGPPPLNAAVARLSAAEASVAQIEAQTEPPPVARITDAEARFQIEGLRLKPRHDAVTDEKARAVDASLLDDVPGGGARD